MCVSFIHSPLPPRLASPRRRAWPCLASPSLSSLAAAAPVAMHRSCRQGARMHSFIRRSTQRAIRAAAAHWGTGGACGSALGRDAMQPPARARARDRRLQGSSEDQSGVHQGRSVYKPTRAECHHTTCPHAAAGNATSVAGAAKSYSVQRLQGPCARSSVPTAPVRSTVLGRRLERLQFPSIGPRSGTANGMALTACSGGDQSQPSPSGAHRFIAIGGGATKG